MPDSLICVKTMADADQIKDTDTFFTALQTQHTFCANILPVNLSDLRLISGNIDWNISLEDLKKLIPAKSDTILCSYCRIVRSRAGLARFSYGERIGLPSQILEEQESCK